MVSAITTAASDLSDGLVSIATAVAPLAAVVVVGIAGFRVLVKLFNRGVGK